MVGGSFHSLWLLQSLKMAPQKLMKESERANGYMQVCSRAWRVCLQDVFLVSFPQDP